MAPSKKTPVVQDAVDTENETKLMALLSNDPDTIVAEGVKFTVQRPSFPLKYKSQAWSNKKLKEMDITVEDTENGQISFYITWFGVLNAHIIGITLPDKSQYSFDPEVDTEYKFLFEKYVMEEVYKQGLEDSAFVFTVLDKLLDWQNSTKLEKDELGKS